MSKMKRPLETIQEEKTKVIFRKFPDGDIIAFFPELPGTNNARTCLNYMHIGQHGSGQDTCEGTRPATSEEYKALYDELTNVIGYELIVVKRFTHQMYFKRVEQLRRAAK